MLRALKEFLKKILIQIFSDSKK